MTDPANEFAACLEHCGDSRCVTAEPPLEQEVERRLTALIRWTLNHQPEGEALGRVLQDARARLVAPSQPPRVDELGNLRDPDAAVGELLQSYFWLKTLKPNTRYVRLQDDHDGEHRGYLSVTIGEDGDAWLSLDADARFRMPGSGGGASQFTRTALVILAEGIRRDNVERPLRPAPTKGDSHG